MVYFNLQNEVAKHFAKITSGNSSTNARLLLLWMELFINVMIKSFLLFKTIIW